MQRKKYIERVLVIFFLALFIFLVILMKKIIDYMIESEQADKDESN